MNHSNEDKEAEPQSPRYANIVHHAKAPPKKHLARSKSPDINHVSKRDQIKSKAAEQKDAREVDGRELKPVAKQ